MTKSHKIILKETAYISIVVITFSILMQLFFLIIKKWDLTVLLGNLLSDIVSIGNFYLMGLTVQSATKKENKKAKTTMMISQMLRMVLIFIIIAVGITLPYFHPIACLIPLFFPRIAIALYPLFQNDKIKK